MSKKSFRKKQKAVRIKNIKWGVNSSFFDEHMYVLTSQKKLNNNLLQSSFFYESPVLDLRFKRSGLQDAYVVRNRKRASVLAKQIVDDQGKIDLSLLAKIEGELIDNLYFLGQEGEDDALFQEHFLMVVRYLQKEDVRQFIMSVGKPEGNRAVQEIIRKTMEFSNEDVVDHVSSRRAIVSACFTYLRQSVGSCFATAPAIFVQSKRLDLLIKDLIELVTFGRLTRVIDGNEQTVPICKEWGVAGLRQSVFIHRNLQKSSSFVWLSPSVHFALIEVGVLRKEEGFHKRAVQIMHRLRDLISLEKGFWSGSIQELFHSLIYNFFKNAQTPVSEQRIEFLADVACDLFQLQTDNPLLRSWEYTLASFAESKAALRRWNVYASLGLDFEQKGGLASSLLKKSQELLDVANHKVELLQQEYESRYVRVKGVESRLERAGSEQEIRWLKIDYQVQVTEMENSLSLRNEAKKKAETLSNLPNLMLAVYDTLFQDYFQEVYDPNFSMTKVRIYDDSPAGFRLLYKHGRKDPSQWTLIYKPEEFVDALCSFLMSTEVLIIRDERFLQLEHEISQIVTALIQQVRTEEFLETAFYRMAAWHNEPVIKNPLENWHLVNKKPWAYVSGGSVDNFIHSYFERLTSFQHEHRWVERAEELCAFIISSIRKIPYSKMKELVENKGRLLMHSPTHVFLLTLEQELLQEVWNNDIYPYTWLQEYVIRPGKQFFLDQVLSTEMQCFLVSKLSNVIEVRVVKQLIQEFRSIRSSMGISQFREKVLEILSLTYAGRQVVQQEHIEEEFDSILYSSLPMQKGENLSQQVIKVLSSISHLSEAQKKSLVSYVEKFFDKFSVYSAQLFASDQVQQIVRGLFQAWWGKAYCPINIHKHVSKAFRLHNLAYPTPFVFADSNWYKDFFSFVVNPGTQTLQLWRVNSCANKGKPFIQWTSWYNGERKTPDWGIYLDFGV